MKIRKDRKETMPEYQEYYEPDYTGRFLEFVKDKDGNGWLCDKGIDHDGDLRAGAAPGEALEAPGILDLPRGFHSLGGPGAEAECFPAR